MKRRTMLNNSTWEYIFNLDMPMLGGVSPLHGRSATGKTGTIHVRISIRKK